MRGFNDLLERAVDAAQRGHEALREALDQLPAPIYVTDADGVITYFNPACIDFTGRRPEVGRDRWCVTWRLHTTSGEFLPHDECPMAQAINTRRTIRGASAVAERPDGTRVLFRPYPTPIFDSDGVFTGAVNILEEVTNDVRAGELLAHAARCRRLAQRILDDSTAETLTRMAEEYETKARALNGAVAKSYQPPA